MDATKTQAETQNPTPLPVDPTMQSCRKKKSDDATFMQDVRDHIDEFIHASMDEHKTCFKNTIQKMFGMSKVVAERSNLEGKEVESMWQGSGEHIATSDYCFQVKDINAQGKNRENKCTEILFCFSLVYFLVSRHFIPMRNGKDTAYLSV